ncbi:CD276 antigen isoform X1 [Chiroxiphia lanceolata]|uniref:CD276 antigen isoform X1 n=1 Tax=Chiroxiphia lanceolata TaxID=296741 RepID=UPI0013CE52A7|nr:CD276 antigen isoform X1 [Chiroxiphia lanceolata]
MQQSLGWCQAGGEPPPRFCDRLRALVPGEKAPCEDSPGCAFSCFLIQTLLLPRMFFLLLVLGVLAGAMEIQVPDEPVVALFGQDATLRCSFSPEANFSLDDLSLIWQLTDTKRLVHRFSGGRDQLEDQGRVYTNRTSLFYDQLPQGNVSLLLRRVEIADEGSFTCFVRVRDYNSAAVTLQVAAPYSKPSVHLEPSKDLKPGDLAIVTCHASRGYPEASVLWQDSRGSNITENITTSQVANEEGLFDVHSVLQVLVEPSITYSCLVQNLVLQQHGHASVTITDLLGEAIVLCTDGLPSKATLVPPTPSMGTCPRHRGVLVWGTRSLVGQWCSPRCCVSPPLQGQHLAFPAAALWVTVGLAICVLGLLVVLAYVCHKKIRESCEEEEENAGTEEQDEEGEEPKTALQLLKSVESKEDNEQEID